MLKFGDFAIIINDPARRVYEVVGTSKTRAVLVTDVEGMQVFATIPVTALVGFRKGTAVVQKITRKLGIVVNLLSKGRLFVAFEDRTFDKVSPWDTTIIDQRDIPAWLLAKYSGG